MSLKNYLECISPRRIVAEMNNTHEAPEVLNQILMTLRHTPDYPLTLSNPRTSIAKAPGKHTESIACAWGMHRKGYGRHIGGVVGGSIGEHMVSHTRA